MQAADSPLLSDAALEGGISDSFMGAIPDFPDTTIPSLPALDFDATFTPSIPISHKATSDFEPLLMLFSKDELDFYLPTLEPSFDAWTTASGTNESESLNDWIQPQIEGSNTWEAFEGLDDPLFSNTLLDPAML